MNKRITIGAAVAVAGLIAVPSIAAADSSCVYDAANKRATIQLGNPSFGSATVIRPGFLPTGVIGVADGTGPFRSCSAPGEPTKVATTFNIDKLVVRGSPGFESVELNEGFNLGFAPGATPEPTGKSGVLVALLTGTGGDVLRVVGTPNGDAFSAYGSTFGGQVDLDNDGDTDAVMSNPARITLHGGTNGNDRLAATSVFGERATLPVTLDGTDGNDTMFGGDASDLMLGGNGDDFVNSVGGGADVITGDAGSDTAFVDASDTVSTVEFKTFVGKLGGSAKTITGDAGKTVSLPLTWTHPKAWKQLRSIEALIYDGAKQVGSVKLTPAGAVSAKGSVSLAKRATKIGHHGKTVTAKLGLRLAESLKGQTLSVDIAATDRKGHRQLQTAARSIRLNP